jgi:glycosyltransferase involved in cell wall biosynthesis
MGSSEPNGRIMSGIHVLYSFPQRVGTSGIGMTAWYQVSGLLREGVEVDLYCGSLERPIEHLNSLKQTLVPIGIKIPMRLLGRHGAMILHDKIVAKALRHTYRESHIDLIHCWPSGSLETLKTAREMGIKTVLERPCAHTRFVFEITAQECGRLGIKLNRHYSSFDASRLAREEEEFSIADTLLCPSKHVIKTFLERGFKENQMLLGRRGYDADAFIPGEQSRDKNNTHLFTMVYVGEGHPLKGLHFALRAWVTSEASKQGRFYICGKLLPEYRDLLKPLLDHPSVEYLGYVRDVAKIMRQCSALVLPSLSEGFAKVTCESRACGCVLLVSCAAGEACEHMKNGLIHKAGDVDTLRQHIDLLASNKELYDRLRTHSLATLSDLTWENASKTLVSAYHECIGNKGYVMC